MPVGYAYYQFLTTSIQVSFATKLSLSIQYDKKCVFFLFFSFSSKGMDVCELIKA